MKQEMINKAHEVFAMLKAAMDHDDWKYEANDEECVLLSGCTGEDFPITFFFKVDPQRECLTFRSSPFAKFDDEHFMDGALATCVANHGLVFGHFDYDASDNSVRYTMANSIVGTEFEEAFFIDMLQTAVRTVDNYNDRFIMLSKGMIDIKQFLKMEADD